VNGFHLEFPFIFSNLLKISHLKACKYIHTLYIILSMILQMAGLGNIIGGITTAATAAENFVDTESVKGKFNFWY